MPRASPGASPTFEGASADDARRARRQFATTRWSVVLRAGRFSTATSEPGDALARLCRTYWYPLYAHVRRRGFSATDAEDLTQAFFARLLARRSIAHADPGRGRFRSFMLTALNHFLADEWDKARAAKRGGAGPPLAFDFAGAEERLASLADFTLPPDRAFDRAWALALLGEVLGELEAEYGQAGKAHLFRVLKPTLTGSRSTQPYAALAAELNRNESAVKVAVHRLRRRYRVLLESAVADTLESPAAVGAELQTLLEALGP